MLIRRVRGRSMLPSLPPGTLVFAGKPRHVKVGDIVVARSPAAREIIKRVQKLEGERYYLVGDNRLESTDSREFGAVNKSAILGVVSMKIKFANATLPRPVKSKRLLIFPYAAAALLVVFVLAQLVTFDKLEAVFDGITPDWGKVWLAIVTLSEVFALPYLLRMRLSRLARFVSLLLGYMVVLEWLTLLNLTMPVSFGGVPLFGTAVTLNVMNSFLLLIVLLALMSISHVVLGGEPGLKPHLKRLKK